MLAKYITNLIGGNERMNVTINPDAGKWKIISNFTDWSYQVVGKNLTNNTINEVVIASKSNITHDWDGNTSIDGQTFSVSDLSIVDEIEKDVDKEDMKKATKIYAKFTLTAQAVDKYVKFRQTNNPNDVINDSYQTFPFTIILK
jgi:hypothetical protein